MKDNLRDDWNRRIEHDHRYWMSDGFASDEEMFKAGQRDFSIIKKALQLEETKNLEILEVGCGVGRLLKSAGRAFSKAYGIDVSDQAIAKAKTLVGGNDNIELIHGDGENIPLPDSSIDAAYCYATFSVIPVAVFMRNLLELSRVLKNGSRLVVQVYLGVEHVEDSNNTLGIRCYDESRYRQATELAGFKTLSLDELVLPIGDVSDYEEGIIAYIHSMEKVGDAEADVAKLCSTISSEEETSGDFDGSHLEYTMAITLAQALVEKGQLEHALRTFEFARTNYRKADPEIERITEEIRKVLAT